MVPIHIEMRTILKKTKLPTFSKVDHSKKGEKKELPTFTNFQNLKKL